MSRPSVILGVISHDTPENLLAALVSAGPYVDRALVLFSGRDDPCVPLLVSFSATHYDVSCDFLDADCESKRNRCLDLARPLGEWVLMLDTDERLLPGGRLPDLASADPIIDAFLLESRSGGVSHRMPRLVRSSSRARFGGGGIHEALIGLGPSVPWDHLPYDGTPRARSSDEYLMHARALATRLERDPTDARAAFYLASSLRDAGDLPNALAAYVRRANMTGAFAEENFWSWVYAGRIAWALGLPWEAVESFFRYAITWGPDRAEPRRDLARLYAGWGRPAYARLETELADALAYPTTATLFVERTAYAPHRIDRDAASTASPSPAQVAACGTSTQAPPP